MVAIVAHGPAGVPTSAKCHRVTAELQVACSAICLCGPKMAAILDAQSMLLIGLWKTHLFFFSCLWGASSLACAAVGYFIGTSHFAGFQFNFRLFASAARLMRCPLHLFVFVSRQISNRLPAVAYVSLFFWLPIMRQASVSAALEHNLTTISPLAVDKSGECRAAIGGRPTTPDHHARASTNSRLHGAVADKLLQRCERQRNQFIFPLAICIAAA